MVHDHPPAKARALVQEAKRGSRPFNVLLKEARAIPDPSFAAEALYALSQSPKVELREGEKLLSDAASLLGRVERDWRRAEVLAEVARTAPRWREGQPGAQAAVARFGDLLVRVAFTLEGQALSQALPTVARVTPDGRVAELLHHALQRGSDPAEDGKAVLAVGEKPGVRDTLGHLEDAALRARLLGYLHTRGANAGLAASLGEATALDPAKQVEVVRGIIASLGIIEDLVAVADRLPADAEASARLLCALAARADKLGNGDQAAAWFDAAEQRLSRIPEGKARQGVARNLATGRERLGARPAVRREVHEPVSMPSTAPTKTARHLLALADTYEGKLSDVHLRAIGRAAPLCWAFGLDLALIGFPTDDLGKLVRLAGKETNIGEGRGYLERLHSEGRIHLVFCDTDASPDWTSLGLAIATTPAPVDSKQVDFEGALAKAKAAKAPRLCVLMGLGKKGLNPAMLSSAPVHLELTGKGVSLETATAMGILAERMRTLPTL